METPKRHGIENLKPAEPGNKRAVGHGRPRGKSLSTLLKEAMEAPLTLLDKETKKQETKTTAEWIAKRAVLRALQGDFKYFKEIKDSIDGRPIQKIVSDTKVDLDLSTLTDDQLNKQIERLLKDE